MRAWIFAAGTLTNISFYRSLKIPESDILICADGGYDHLRLIGIRPSIVIGDMDSITTKIDENVKCITYPREKDKTDTQLAVEYALDRAYNEIVLIGATGGRLDHTMANIMLLSLIADRGAEGLILTDENRITLVTDSISMDIKRGKGDNISFIPLTETVEGITTDGLLYNMDNTTAKKGDTLTMSNEFRAHIAHIYIDKGKLLVICDV